MSSDTQTKFSGVSGQSPYIRSPHFLSPPPPSSIKLPFFLLHLAHLAQLCLPDIKAEFQVQLLKFPSVSKGAKMTT